MLPRHLYVHVPFCARRCAYCDFSIAVRANVPVDDYVRAVETELALKFGRDEPFEVDTLYLGGGTPSRLGGDGVARLVDAIRRRVSLASDAEVTIEANPDDVTRNAVELWREAGVNRLSIGSQSFDDRVLEWMHRTHRGTAIADSVDAAHAGGIENISLDLIFALPPEVERDWDRDLERAIALAPEHLSLYGLTVEPATPLGRWRDRGTISDAPDERYEREYLLAHDALVAAGFDHYEVSNYGRPGRWSRHNGAYWTGAAYAGTGPSAHEFSGRERRWNVSAYAEWQRRLDSGESPIADSERLTSENRVAEDVYLGLRTSAGLALSGAEFSYVERWIEAGWGKIDATGRLALTAAGWLRLDALAADLTLFRSR